MREAQVGDTITIPDGAVEAVRDDSGEHQSNVHYLDKRPSPIALGPVSIEDMDRLWDWVRSDREGTKEFLGVTHANSQEFFEHISSIYKREASGSARLRSIRRGQELIGFLLLDPILQTPVVGTCHLYIGVEYRGHITEIIPAMIATCDTDFGGMALIAIVQRKEWVPVLEASGFEAQIVLTRRASGFK